MSTNTQVAAVHRQTDVHLAAARTQVSDASL
jgi:hypothetical protein